MLALGKVAVDDDNDPILDNEHVSQNDDMRLCYDGGDGEVAVLWATGTCLKLPPSWNPSCLRGLSPRVSVGIARGALAGVVEIGLDLSTDVMVMMMISWLFTASSRL